MKIEIAYTENIQLWRLEALATTHGYEKTDDCYWVQIFRGKNGDSIVTTREDGELISDPVARLAAILDDAAPKNQPTKVYTYTEGHHHEETTSAIQAMTWRRDGRRVTVWGHHPNGEQYHVTIPGTPQPEPHDENRDHCKRIAEELEAHTNGTVYRCPDCGEILELPDDVGDKYKCPHCGTVSEVDELEQLSVWDYLEDALDIEYRIGSDKQYRSVCIMVACGGPNIYIDTASKSVELYWWGDRASYPISTDATDAVDEWAEELYQC